MPDSYIIDYYKRPFLKLHEQLCERIPMIQWYLHERGVYWNKISFGLYDYNSAIPLLNEYATQIENKIKQIVEQKSFLYWIHVYRRIAPGEPVHGCTKSDIPRTRAIMEISFQKYGKSGFCNHINKSRNVSIGKILNGLLLNAEFTPERNAIQKNKDSLVLTEFGVEELNEVYELEKLCYEMNLINKAIRLLGKGCVLSYTEKRKWYVFICRDDVQLLMDNYDKRLDENGITSSYLGVYYSEKNDNTLGYCLFPIYNNGDYSFDLHKNIIHDFYKADLATIGNNTPNFLIHAFDIQSYYKAHREASSSFFETNNVSFEAIMIVIKFLSFEIFGVADKIEGFIDLIFRGYRLFKKKELIKTLISMKRKIASDFGIQGDLIKNTEIYKALSYISFSNKKQSLLDLHYCSLYYPLYEFNDFYLIDFVWIYRFFLTMFFKVQMKDQNFKGIILENSVKHTRSTLPTTRIRAKDGSEKQIDYSFLKDETLFILECKAVSMSVAFEAGDITAVKYRAKEVVNKSLLEVDEKTDWLLSHKEILQEYAPSAIFIVGIGVSAFVEYIPSKEKKYWLNDEIPRVLLPKEIESIRRNDVKIKYNFQRIK